MAEVRPPFKSEPRNSHLDDSELIPIPHPTLFYFRVRVSFPSLPRWDVEILRTRLRPSPLSVHTILGRVPTLPYFRPLRFSSPYRTLSSLSMGTGVSSCRLRNGSLDLLVPLYRGRHTEIRSVNGRDMSERVELSLL